jgi:hypothetical protein
MIPLRSSEEQLGCFFPDEQAKIEFVKWKEKKKTTKNKLLKPEDKAPNKPTLVIQENSEI